MAQTPDSSASEVLETVLKLGTRKSLLAWAQSGWVAREIERLNPGVRVELVGIETRGDRSQGSDVALQSTEGKDFFVAELDDALLSGRVDLSVHSMKDLSLERPREVMLAAVPKREDPRDVVLFGPGVMEKLAAGRRLTIGTSAPRRIENLPPFLVEALPVVNGRKAEVRLVEIRGNVNTRLSRVHLPDGDPKHCDAVVLALAGLDRLMIDKKGRPELERLLEGVRIMVMPLRECPTAPGQGALAIECRVHGFNGTGGAPEGAPGRAIRDARTLEAVSKLHDPASASATARERSLLAEWGGGCHQRFGATERATAELGPVFYVRGAKSDGTFVEEMRWQAPSRDGARFPKIWDGTYWRATGSAPATRMQPPEGFAVGADRAVFVAHSRAADGDWAERIRAARIWTSGTSSWFRLAAMGLWVEGCAEGLGIREAGDTLAAPLLRLPPMSDWTILTHADARDEWEQGAPIATYELATSEYSELARITLREATDIFWSSGSQWERLRDDVPRGASHACGPGKTAARLRKAGIEPLVFPSAKEWKQWLENGKHDVP